MPTIKKMRKIQKLTASAKTKLLNHAPLAFKINANVPITMSYLINKFDGVFDEGEIYDMLRTKYNKYVDEFNANINVKKEEPKNVIVKPKMVLNMNAEEVDAYNINNKNNLSNKKKIKNIDGVSSIINLIVRHIINNQLKGLTYIELRSKNGELKKLNKYDLPEWKSKKELYKWWRDKSVITDWTEEGGSDPNLLFDEGDYLQSYKPTIIGNMLWKQSFKEGLSNCLLTPIREWINDKISEAKCNSTMYKYATKLNDLDKFEKKYFDTGVSEDKIYEICNKLNVGIKIYQPFNPNPVWNIKPIKKPIKTFVYMNTKYNHIDELKNDNFVMFYDKKGEKTSLINNLDDMKHIKNEIEKENRHYITRQFKDNINMIYTFDKIYKLETDYNVAVSEFNKHNDFIFDKIKINHRTDSVSRFILKGCEYNGFKSYPSFLERVGLPSNFLTDKFNWYNANDDEIDVNFEKFDMYYKFDDLLQLDEKKAYSQYRKTPFYCGFLGKITDYREGNYTIHFVKNNVGMYQLKNIQYPHDNNIIKHIKYLRVLNEGCIKPTAEILYYNSLGIRFDIVRGAYGVKAIDFEFTDEMINGKTIDGNKKISWYAKWVGSCNSRIEQTTFNMRGEREFFETLNYNLRNDNIHTKVGVYDEENKIATISMEAKSVYHMSHITAFITSYARIRLLNVLQQIDFNDVYKVVGDGIYYKGSYDITSKTYRPKEISEHGILLNNTDTFTNPSLDANLTECGAYKENHHTEYHKGAGGSGKTHININDKGNVRVCYMSPSWKLAKAKKKEMEEQNKPIMVSTIARLYLDNYKTDEIDKKYNTLIIDEVSMMTNEEKDYIIKTYPHHKLIFCGDVGFQLPPVQQEDKDGKKIPYTLFNETGIGLVKSYDYVYRFKCEKLRNMAIKLRKFLEIDDENTTEFSKNLVKKYIKQYYSKNIIKRESIDCYYEVNDMILASTKLRCKEYTDNLTGTFGHIEKYLITENSSQYSRGDIVICSKKNKPLGGKIAHAFTAHKIQGETAEHKLFIDLNRLFEPQHLYTMISRARRLKQIYLVVD